MVHLQTSLHSTGIRMPEDVVCRGLFKLQAITNISLVKCDAKPPKDTKLLCRTVSGAPASIRGACGDRPCTVVCFAMSSSSQCSEVLRLMH
jgi:hypothetical protein